MMICPNCASENFTLDQVKCDSCGWNKLNEEGIQNFLTEKDRSNEFANSYIDNYEKLAVEDLKISIVDKKFLQNQAKNTTKYIGNFKELEVCDVGVGQGFLCKEILKLGAKHVSGIDISRSYLKQFTNKSNFTPYLANAENLPFKEHFDILTCTDVMEHVLNVGSLLYCINRSLKLGGIAAIRVPFRESLLQYSPHMGFSHGFAHFRSFNKDILRTYLQEAGFFIKSFHLDGFSLGSPRSYLYSSQRRKNFYHYLVNKLTLFLKNPADITLWNSRFTSLIMRPVEITVIAKKMKAL